MRNTLIAGLVVLLSIALILSGCSEATEDEAIKNDNSLLKGENASLKSDLESAQADITTLQANYEALLTKSEETASNAQADITTLQANYEALLTESEETAPNAQTAAELMEELKLLQTSYDSLLKTTQQSGLINPTWEELQNFLLEDKTDEIPYALDEFDCNGFTITLRDNAWLRGFRSAFVAIGFGQNAAGHAFNAFETTDKGIVYIEPQRDNVAYLEKGSIFATIPLDGVKDRFINCDMAPTEFWGDISYTDYTGDIYDYPYYQNYSQRRDFYTDSIDAYNTDVESYNAAVAAFNQGSRTYSRDDIESWGEKITTWAKNIDALIDDLGSNPLLPMEAVSTIEIYWN